MAFVKKLDSLRIWNDILCFFNIAKLILKCVFKLLRRLNKRTL